MGMKEDLGSFIARCRKKRGLSQAELAEKVFMSPQAISSIEKNSSSLAVDTAKRIADALGMSLSDLEKRELPEKPKEAGKDLNEKDLASKLKESREKAGLSRADAAKAAGVSERTVRNYENGSRAPSFQYVEKVSELSHANFGSFFEPAALRPRFAPWKIAVVAASSAVALAGGGTGIYFAATSQQRADLQGNSTSLVNSSIHDSAQSDVSSIPSSSESEPVSQPSSSDVTSSDTSSSEDSSSETSSSEESSSSDSFCTVSFYLDEAKTELWHSETYMAGDLIGKPADPEKIGHTFFRWLTGPESAWDFDEDRVQTSLDLYADWNVLSYTIYLNAMGGTCEEEITVTYGEPYSLPTPQKSGYTFKQWFHPTTGFDAWSGAEQPFPMEGEYAFDHDIFLTASYVTGEGDNVASNYLLGDGEGVIGGYIGEGTDLVIPSTCGSKPTKGIGESAFDGNDKITSVSLPSSVETIQALAFRNCTSLQTVTFSYWLESILMAAFEGCSALESASFSEKLTLIDSFAFHDCSALKTVFIPASVTMMGNYVFQGCDNLTIYCEAESDPWSTNWNPDNRPVVWGTPNPDTSEPPAKEGISIVIPDPAPIDLVIPEGRTYIEDYEYSRKSISSVTFPSSVKSIGKSAFADAGLGSVSFSEGLVSISAGAFAGNRIKSVSLPRGLKQMGRGAFIFEWWMKGIFIPNSVVDMGPDVFDSCANLTIFCEAESNPWGDVNWNPLNRPVVWGATELPEEYLDIPDDDPAYDTYPTYIAPENLAIENEQFKGNKEIISVTLGPQVTSIGNWAFQNCVNLSSLTLSEGLGFIGVQAFSGCSSLKSVVLPKGLKSVRTAAFEGCSSLESIYIPSSVTMMEEFIFYGCDKLTIYCEAESDPWCAGYYCNPNNLPVVWGYKG